MNKRILILTMTVFTLVIMTLPMIPAAQAYGWEKSVEIYDVEVSGWIVADSEVDFRVWRNWQYGKYTAHSVKFGTQIEEIKIEWDDEELIGTEVLRISYMINTDTMEGIVRLKVAITFDDGKFVGNMLWIGDLVLQADNTVNPNFGGGSWAWYTYWRGTGAYAGWTITQKFGTAVAEPEAYLIIR